jgi:uncharacterized protein HemX
MAEPTGTPSTPRSPFHPPPPAPKVRTGGPGKPLVLGCLILLVVAGIGLMAALYYVGQHYDQVFAWSIARLRDAVEPRLPKDLPAEDRQRLDDAFTAAQGAAGAARHNPAAAQKLQSLMLELAGKSGGSGTFTREQVREISATLEKIAEVGRPEGKGAP